MSAEAPENLWLAELWLQNRDRLVRLIATRMSPVLLRRMSPDDVAQETYLACGRRMKFLQEHSDVPVFVKLRKLALQTITDMERKHLAAGKRDAMKESCLAESDNDVSVNALSRFADSLVGPRTHLERMELLEQTRRAMRELPENDREILELRHFEELSNTECAAALGIEPKAASIRYVRALKRMKELLGNVGV
ncbi:MAG: sigma-70 family RNA polymerase sigma factor [Akkermansia sp.]|nr:sigma-70 family RNA polymerase sigma factor [Akkermansia sp.]